MATLDIESSRGRRGVRGDLPLVPFIDFLLCIVAFLLATAVSGAFSRIESTARAPAEPGPAPPPAGELHVHVDRKDRFTLEWREGSTVVYREDVTRDAPRSAAPLRFPTLSKEVRAVWMRHGAHRGESDARRDRAVLHASNASDFEVIVATLDAIAATRKGTATGSPGGDAAFDVAFAVN